MAAKALCCTAEDDERPDSPALPNARVYGNTPARQPLLQEPFPNQGSRHTSARTEDLHELRLIFDNARDGGPKRTPPTNPNRSRFGRSSIHSLHSIHRIKSVHALIRRKLSKDLSKPHSHSASRSGDLSVHPDQGAPDTVLRTPKDGPNLQLKITKEDLRKNLLSDRKRAEGGYDSDAEVLDDIARKVGKQPSKRPSIHSIDWTSSPSSVHPTPLARRNSDTSATARPYQLAPIQLVGKTSATTLWNQYCSSPNLRTPGMGGRDRRIRRSHSFSSVERPHGSQRKEMLPKISFRDSDTIPWSVSTLGSLRISNLPSSAQLVEKPRDNDQRPTDKDKDTNKGPGLDELERPIHLSSRMSSRLSSGNHENPVIHIQEAAASPRPSNSIKRNRQLAENELSKGPDKVVEEENPRSSVHLYSMRISHHLRSGSLVSWEKVPDTPTNQSVTQHSHAPSMSENSPSVHPSVRSRHHRQTSSSGFASSRVPSKWGRVVNNGHEQEEMSSIYSSRPHSPPASVGGSVSNLSRTVSHYDTAKTTVTSPSEKEGGESIKANKNESPHIPEHQSIHRIKSSIQSDNITLFGHSRPIARKNSVADTKKSKFREEFTPSPPRKRSATAMSILRMLKPRSNFRSQSDANLKLRSAQQVDGPFDSPLTAKKQQLRQSRSVISLRKKKAPLNDEPADPVWEQALKAFQDERQSMFLSKDNGLTVSQQPLFRARSPSASRRKSMATPNPSPMQTRDDVHAPPSPGGQESQLEGRSGPQLLTRRSALIGVDPSELSADQLVQIAFDKQTDDVATVGAWGRYPSHTRYARTGSAGTQDKVQTRDFALEAAIKFVTGGDGDGIDPATIPRDSEGSSKKKRRVGSPRMAKSHSMTFGKQFIKNYTRMFRSQSTEFRHHGYGHRSSITTGGMLEYPELEVLPDVWRRGVVDNSNERLDRTQEGSEEQGSKKRPDPKGKMKMEMKDFLDKSRAKNDKDDNTKAPNIMLDGTAEADGPSDRARVWSTYYEDCVPSFPRASADLNARSHPNLTSLLEIDDFQPGSGMSTGRHSFESRRASMRSCTVPSRFKHSRHGSRVSVLSRASIVSSFKSTSQEADAVEGVTETMNVRRSTMDLVAFYREQEFRERERVLSLLRAGSVTQRVGGLGGQ